MNNKIVFVLIMVLSYSINSYAQFQCGGGDQKPMDSIPPDLEEWPVDSLDVPVQNPSDSNEIIGTRSYDALGDTLQWVAATASLPYAICFENHPKLASFIIENDLDII